MEELFIPYLLALKLKELGFNEPCISTFRTHATNPNVNPFEHNLDYHTKTQLDHNRCPINSSYVNDWISAPLWQQGFDFLLSKISDEYSLEQVNDKFYIVYEGLDQIREVLVDGNREVCLEKLIKIVEYK